MQSVKAIVIFDIDGVIRDVASSYRRAIADTVEHFTAGAHRPTMDEIDNLKSEGVWNNDWQASLELTYRYFESQGKNRKKNAIVYDAVVDFFQSRYRGTDPENFDGYITTEPLLLQVEYLETLSAAGIAWGFFSGATRGSAEYVLKKRLGLNNPILTAMEDAPGKPNPTGLLATVDRILELHSDLSSAPVIYAGDTVADLFTVIKARERSEDRQWIAVGILPPHVQKDRDRAEKYTRVLEVAGASVVYDNIQKLTPAEIDRVASIE